LFLEEPEHICRCDRPQNSDDIVDEVGQRKETRQGKDKQDGREKCQEKIVRQLSRLSEAVVFTGFLRGALEQFAPAQWHVERGEHGDSACNEIAKRSCALSEAAARTIGLMVGRRDRCGSLDGELRIPSGGSRGNAPTANPTFLPTIDYRLLGSTIAAGFAHARDLEPWLVLDELPWPRRRWQGVPAPDVPAPLADEPLADAPADEALAILPKGYRPA
jgi:hypothetical protein